MRKYFLLFSISIFSFVNTCVSQTEHVYHFPSDSAAVNKSLPDYIDLVEGRKIEGKISKVDLIKKEVYDKITGSITIGGTQYNLDDIAGYQYQGVYYSRADSKKHMIIRVKHGKINFFKEIMDAQKVNSIGIVEYQWTHLRHLIQKGEGGEVEFFSYKLLKKYVSDFQPALDILADCSWNKKTWQGCEDLMEKAIDIYNSKQ
jgi:hypothetical protein